jgi:hypothetical protein
VDRKVEALEFCDVLFEDSGEVQDFDGPTGCKCGDEELVFSGCAAFVDTQLEVR